MKNISKIAAVFAAILTLCVSFTAMADDDVKVYVDDVQLEFDVNPIIEDGRTLVPLRAIFEALGAQVEWDGETQTATAISGADVVTVTIDSNTLYKNGAAVELDVPAKIVDDRTLVPVRAVSESFDADVVWDGNTRSVIITTALFENAETAADAETPLSVELTEKAELTDEDMEILKDMAATLRYDFEQSTLPDYVFENADSMYEVMGDNETFLKTVTEIWNTLAASYVIYVQYQSETLYSIDADSLTESNLLEYFDDVINKAKIDSGSYIEATGCAENDGMRLAVITFKSADDMADCKYIGIAASEDGTVRYFTAENDYIDPDNWYFCEVIKDGRSTIAAFEKTGDTIQDMEFFVEIAAYVYSGE
ncbi:MAG: copper amine oxidase N-terminal domain-containing protein [Firmicutes bacterium]|nr:copper amine oxidase N-terminal domain-containing protein [Bacillota bacterium]